MPDDTKEKRRPRRIAGYLLLGIFLLVFLLLAAGIIPLSWMWSILLIMVVIVMLRVTLGMVLDRQERIGRAAGEKNDRSPRSSGSDPSQ